MEPGENYTGRRALTRGQGSQPLRRHTSLMRVDGPVRWVRPSRAGLSSGPARLAGTYRRTIPYRLQGFAARAAQISSLPLRTKTCRLAYAGGDQADLPPTERKRRFQQGDAADLLVPLGSQSGANQLSFVRVEEHGIAVRRQVDARPVLEVRHLCSTSQTCSPVFASRQTNSPDDLAEKTWSP